MARPIVIPLPPDGKETLTITNPTPELRENRAELRRLADSALQSGTRSIDYSTYRQPQQAAPQQAINPTIGQRVDAQRQVALAQSGVDPREGGDIHRTTWQGIRDAAVRGTAPTAIGYMIGGVPGAATVAGWQAVGPFVTGLANKLGEQMHGEEGMFGDPGDPLQVISNYLTTMGYEEPDTLVEEFVEVASEAALQTGTVAIGAQNIQGQGPVRNFLRNFLGETPGGQTVGAVTGVGWMKAMEEALDRVEQRRGRPIRPAVRTLFTMGAGMLGGSWGEGLMAKPSVRQQKGFVDDLAEARRTPQQAQEMIEQGREMLGEELPTSIIAPPTEGSRIRRQQTREAWGGIDRQARIQRARVSMTDDLLENLNVDIGDNIQETVREIAESFAEPRRASYDAANAAWTEAYKSIPDDAIVPAENAVSFLDEQIDLFRRAGEDRTGKGTGNSNQEILDELIALRNSLIGKTGEEFRAIRNNLRQGFSSDTSNVVENVRNSLYNYVNRDIGNAIQEYGGPKMYQEYRDANATLSEHYKDFGDHILRSLVSEDTRGRMMVEADSNVIRNLVLTQDVSPEVIEYVLPRLGEGGREAVQRGLMQKAIMDSVTEFYDLSETQLATNWKHRMAQYGAAFDEEMLDQIDATAELLLYTKRSENVVRGRQARLLQEASQIPGLTYNIARVTSPKTAAQIGATLGTAGSALLFGRAIGRVWDSPKNRDLLLELAQEGLRPLRRDAILRTLARSVQEEMQSFEGTEQGGQEEQQPTSEALTETQLRME